ncbi:MAG: hypothetical protein MJZ28_11235 [Paludibacteraceae bacterium]|nr:hypothetical protein [Paludibacteraceae bacterium]
MAEERKEKRENPLVSILFNIIIPVFILTKLAKTGTVSLWGVIETQGFGPLYGLLIALAFPTIYFIWDYSQRKKTNAISIIGFISILLTGIIGVFEFPSEWIAYKEASVPFLIGSAVLISLKTKYPLIKTLIYNENFMDVEKIDTILKEKKQEEAFNKILTNATYIVAASFLLSTILNFALAKILIKSPTGTEAFTEELGKMTGLSYIVIALPSILVMSVALGYLYKSMQKVTGLPFEKLLSPQLQEKLEEEEQKQPSKTSEKSEVKVEEESDKQQ